jgi:hypothetical protein
LPVYPFRSVVFHLQLPLRVLFKDLVCNAASAEPGGMSNGEHNPNTESLHAYGLCQTVFGVIWRPSWFLSLGSPPVCCRNA